MKAHSVKSIIMSQAGAGLLFGSLMAGAGLPGAALAAPGEFWGDSYQPIDMYREEPVRRPRRPVLPKGAEKAEKVAVAGKKPQGPLVIAISIQRQQVKVYDANGLFAESPISSGMPGHSTPMGVFSVIQKHKFHRSNIYSGAPMPYMQRITWSGVAMHAGVLPGYPASHGCIRMPMSFAMKMWGWTRMGARVVVTPGEVSPTDLTHPILAQLAPPAPVAELPTAAIVRTADASDSMMGGSPRVLADVTGDSTTAQTDTQADVAAVGSIVAAGAALDQVTADVAIDGGFPPSPVPAAVDFSDVETRAEPSIDPQAVAISAAVAPDTIEPVQAEPAKDQTGSAPTRSAADAVPTPLIKRNAPVAIFISRKDAKIYVRQNFTPLFDMPIEIAGDKALGTHVFTARPAKDEDTKLQWSVVSLPAVARQASMTKDERGGRRRNAVAATVAPTSAGSPADALARLTIPSDLMTRLGDALPSGSSLVVSDQSITQGETGEGTDFILRLR